MENILELDLKPFLSPERLTMLIRALILFAVGIPIIYLISKWFRLYLTKHLSAQQGMIAGKIILYVGLCIIFVMVLRELGFEIGPLLGAAGIIGIALGFASQTSVSNIISGVFLIAEQPFVVGDVITTGNTTGEVLSIDFLSVKLRTFDNKFVRIPNESLLKSEVTTLTRFPIRRADILLGVAYKEDIGKVKKILLDIASENPLCLQEPEPLIIFNGFSSSSIDFKFAVWATKEDWLKMKNQIQEEIKARFEREGIEIPFPHLSLYAGSASGPLTIKIVEN
jgi:small-conductance mechanosensitive channel